MNIVFTGPATLNGVRVTRDLLTESAQAKGCTVQSSVSRTTDYVVASSPNFKNGTGTKLRTARAYGTPVISLDELFTILRGRS